MTSSESGGDQIAAAPDGTVLLPDGAPATPHGRAAKLETGVQQRLRRRDAIFRRSLAAADVVAVLGAFAVGPVLAGGASPTLWILALPVALIAVMKGLGLYDRDANMLAKRTLPEVP